MRAAPVSVVTVIISLLRGTIAGLMIGTHTLDGGKCDWR
jgi:hypothetical protein